MQIVGRSFFGDLKAWSPSCVENMANECSLADECLPQKTKYLNMIAKKPSKYSDLVLVCNFCRAGQSCFGSLKWSKLISVSCRTNKQSWTFCVRFASCGILILITHYCTNPRPHELVGCLILSGVWPTTNPLPNELLCFFHPVCIQTRVVLVV
jgi:hypothetical protein